MSRSFRKPHYKDKDKFMHKYANRKTRRNKTDTDPKTLKNLANQYDITDWNFYCPKDKKAYRK